MDGTETATEFPLLEKWESVAKIRGYYARAMSNLQEIAQEERRKLEDEQENVVTAFKDERGRYRLKRERERGRKAAWERREGEAA